MSPTDHVLSLRLLAHPMTGSAGLTDRERATLIDAAAELERLQRVMHGMSDLVTELLDRIPPDGTT
jgi:hypothetical protein